MEHKYYISQKHRRKRVEKPHPPVRDDAFFALLEGGFRRKRCDGGRRRNADLIDQRQAAGRTQSNGVFVCFHLTVRKYSGILNACFVYQFVELYGDRALSD